MKGKERETARGRSERQRQRETGRGRSERQTKRQGEGGVKGKQRERQGGVKGKQKERDGEREEGYKANKERERDGEGRVKGKQKERQGEGGRVKGKQRERERHVLLLGMIFSRNPLLSVLCALSTTATPPSAVPWQPEVPVVQSVKYMSTNTSTITHTMEVRMMTLQYCIRTRLDDMLTCLLGSPQGHKGEDRRKEPPPAEVMQ